MKTKLWMLGMAVAALTSCTHSEVVEIPESRVIGFDSFVGKNSRAAVSYIETSTLNKFWVYCAKGENTGANFDADDENPETSNVEELYFDGVEVSKNGTDYDYVHKYWVGAKNYRFGAYSNGNEVLNSALTFTANNSGSWGFTFSNYTAADEDLIVALPDEISVNDDATNTTHVNLHFEHLLARVQFVFYTKVDNGLKLKIHPFKFSGKKTETCTVMTDGNGLVWDTNWTFNGSDADYVYGSEQDTLITGPKALYEHYVIPQNNQNLKIDEITIQTLDSNDDVIHTNVFKNVELKLEGDHASWIAGNIYSYQAEITSDAHEIHFKATVEAWDDKSAGDKNIGTVTPTP